MANQPTKYRKFIVGAASAALVASAVAPVALAADFSDVNDKNSHKEAIDALSNAGVITGYQDGTFKPNKDLTRSDVVKLMGKWLLSKEGYSVPTDYKTNPRFSDLNSKSNDELLKMAAVVKDNGIFNGNDGKLLAADKITRENMAVVLVRALDTLEGFDLANYVADQDFKKDVSDLNKAKSEARPAIDVLDYFDITNPAAPIFNPKSTTTRAQFASLLYKAAGTDYSEVKKATVTVESVKSVNATTLEVTLTEAMADLTAKDFKVLVGGAEVVPTSVKVKAGSDNKVYTIEHASLAGTTGTVSVNGKEVAFNYKTPALQSVKATNAKTLTVTFDQAVDTSKASLEVIKSNIKQNVSKATWAADGKSATLELSTKLTKGEYTVNVTGLSDEKLTASVTVQDEMVESIEILSDVAVLNATEDEATVAYQVKNQYGEDVTKTTNLSENSADVKANPATGLVTIKGTTLTAAKVGDKKVAIALVHAESAKSATKVVTVSAKAAASDVTVSGIYNKDGKTLNEDTVLTTDKFYLLVDVKDQYGNAILDKTTADNGLIKSETNPTVVAANGTATKPSFEVLTIDGKKQLALQLNKPANNKVKAGESQITLISTTTGKNASYKVNVSETTRTDAITLSAPAVAVAGEDVMVPVSVLDKEGTEIKDVKILNDADKGVKVTFGQTSLTGTNPFVKDANGNVFIKIPKGDVAEGTTPLVVQSSTFKVATQTIKVEKVAVPTTVRGLKNNLAIKANGSKTLTSADVIVEDQYGREMTKAAVDNYLSTSGKGILVKKADPSSTVVTLPGGGITNQTIKNGGNVVVTAGAANGSETLQFVLADANGTNEVAASTAESTVRVTDGTEYDGYEIAPVGMTQASDVQSAGPTDLTVNGLLNGGKVALEQGPDKDYTATISGGKVGATVTNGKITVPKVALNTEGTGANTEIDTEFTVKVTINATGEVLEQKFTVSPDPVKVQDFFFTTSAVAGNHTGAKAITEATIAEGSTIANLMNGGAVVNFATTDQYDNEKVVGEAAAAPTVTIVPDKVTDVTISNNGTSSASVALKSGVTEAKVTYKVKVGNAMKDVKVTVTP